MNTQPLLSSMHTHTTFCDGKNDVETMCLTAYEMKLYAIGFSAHSPVSRQTGIPSYWNLQDEDVEEYVAEVLDAKKRWQGKLAVFLGYETDYIKDRRSPLDDDIISLNLDYQIGSVHFLFPENGADPFTVDGSAEEFEKGLKEGFNGDAQALMHSYYDAQLEMIALGGFDILGHADLLKKNTLGKNLWPKEIEIIRQREVAFAAAGAGIVIEVNTGGINRKKVNELYPSPEFLHIIREYEIPVIITADAHNAKDINGNYDYALQMLKLAGINEHVLLKEKIYDKAVWHKENI